MRTHTHTLKSRTPKADQSHRLRVRVRRTSASRPAERLPAAGPVQAAVEAVKAPPQPKYRLIVNEPRVGGPFSNLHPEVRDIVGKAVRAYRASGFTQTQLSERGAATPGCIRGWETTTKSPQLATVLMTLRAVGHDLDITSLG